MDFSDALLPPAIEACSAAADQKGTYLNSLRPLMPACFLLFVMLSSLLSSFLIFYFFCSSHHFSSRLYSHLCYPVSSAFHLYFHPPFLPFPLLLPLPPPTHTQMLHRRQSECLPGFARSTLFNVTHSLLFYLQIILSRIVNNCRDNCRNNHCDNYCDLSLVLLISGKFIIFFFFLFSFFFFLFSFSFFFFLFFLSFTHMVLLHYYRILLPSSLQLPPRPSTIPPLPRPLFL